MANKYLVTASISEPKYEAEWKFLAAEEAVVARKMRALGKSWFKDWSIPALGIFSRKDWSKYADELKRYSHKLEKYAAEAEDGFMPVKFSVYNPGSKPDYDIQIQITVSDGEINKDRKAPERPKRLDGRGKPVKFAIPNVLGFSRSGIKITPHSVSAELSKLNAKDGAAVVNQVLHIHSGAGTQLQYQLHSARVQHETGTVEVALQR